MRPIPAVRKIAVLRANSLGDFIFSLPALRALEAAYPDAEIVLLGRPWHADFLATRPSPVDRVVVVPPTQGIRDDDGGPLDDPEELGRFFDEMRQEQFDIAIQLHGGGRYSNPFVKQLGARLTAGLRSPEAEPLDRWVPYVYYQHEPIRYLEVVTLVGGRMSDVEPRIEVTGEDIAEARGVLGSMDRPIGVLNPGVSDFRRRWPAERFAAIGDLLAAGRFRVVITGTPGEFDLGEAVRRRMTAEAENLAGRTSLAALTGLLSLASIVVSNDTGTLHLAQAAGTPTVGIFWCGNLINGGPFTRRLHRAVGSWITHCRVCGRDVATPDRPRPEDCDHAVSFVEAADLRDVAAAVTDLIDYSRLERQSAEPSGRRIPLPEVESSPGRGTPAGTPAPERRRGSAG